MSVIGGPAIGVLTPFLGSRYFGPILTGLARAARATGVRLIAIQTLDADRDQTELPAPPEFALPVAWHHVSAFIAITNAVRPEWLRQIRAAGKPVVMISQEYAEFPCPVVLPDNADAARAAVEHLIGHGHRRIAFAGYLRVHDVQERYQAYQDALRAHGVTPDPDLYFDTGDNHEPGGYQAAALMHAAGLPATAVLAATDYNALGIMGGLAAAGYRLPDQQAIVGFDDIVTAAYSTPSLSTMAQPADGIGAKAVDLVLRQLRGEDVPFTRYRVRMPFAIRESCGCPLERQVIAPVAASRRPTPPSVAPAGTPPPAPSGTPAGVAALEAATADRIEHLMARARAQFEDVTFLQETVGAQFEVSMDLLRSHGDDPSGLNWLARTRARRGCLGLWSSDRPPTEPGTPLAMVGHFTDDRAPADWPPPPLGTSTTASFPPLDLLAVQAQAPDEIIFVIPLRTESRDWGLLAVVSAIETAIPTGRATVSQWAGLLTVALHHHAVRQSQREQEERLRHAALYDGLTGLPNRTLFLDRLTHALDRAQRRGECAFAVLFLDLDGFKLVNDSMGHSVGDELLVQVANRITGDLRPGDTVARFGGDEFLILLESTERLRAPTAVAERLQAILSLPFHLQGQEVVVGVTIGIAPGATRYANAEDVLRDADIAMYWAKARGKGTHAVFDVAMHTKAVHRLQLEAELRQALERGEFEVHFQPIVDLASGQSIAVEALVRWRHPGRGLILPDEFLPIADETGLILPIEAWVTEAACRQVHAWHAQGSELTLSVNVSNRRFWQDDLLDDIDRMLAETGLDPRRLRLEITEGVVMHNVEHARKLLAALRERGIGLHIDDFGTGYSSLEALHELPLDALKIDRSFVSHLGVNPRSGELVRTIVLMGGNLGLDIIAEGIETPRQRDVLRSLGCRYGQGYLFARPSLAGPVPPGRLGPCVAREPGPVS